MFQMVDFNCAFLLWLERNESLPWKCWHMEAPIFPQRSTLPLTFLNMCSFGTFRHALKNIDCFFSGLHICLWSNRFWENLYYDGQTKCSKVEMFNALFTRADISNKSVPYDPGLDIQDACTINLFFVCWIVQIIMPFNYVQASVLRIYNKEIQDLIHHDTDGNENVSGLTIVDVSNINQTPFLIQQVVYSKYTFWVWMLLLWCHFSITF